MQPTRKIILDTTVLSNFAVAARFDLLSLFYRELACTGLGVVEEIHDGIEAGHGYLEMLISCGIGEAYCLSLAAARGYTLGSDDLAARRLATKHGVRLTGILGILVRLVREGRLALDEGNAILVDMIARRYRSPVSKLDEIIAG